MPKFALMVYSILRITSQVEHTRKHNSIDSEKKSVKRNTSHQNHLTVYFHTLLYSGRQTGAADLAAARPIIHCETDHNEEQGLPRTSLMNF